MTRATIWPTAAQDLRFRGVFVNETPEMTTFWGGGGTQFGGGGGQRGPAQRLPRFDVLEPRNVVLAAVWRHVSGFTFRTPRFGT